ncbi:MAG: hypothetical protein ABIH70_01465 [Chloroflexota bacterium]
MSEQWSIWIALLAVLISAVSFFWNWRHSESVFRRTNYPAVAWHRPILSKLEENTAISVIVCNHGPSEIAAIWLGAFLSNKFKTEAWCQYNPTEDSVPIGEELKIIVTENLEEDIRERFNHLYFDKSWHHKGKPKNFKVIFWLSYQPLIADTPPIMRKNFYLLTPKVENNTVASWQIVPISRLRSLLPTFQ